MRVKQEERGMCSRRASWPMPYPYVTTPYGLWLGPREQCSDHAFVRHVQRQEERTDVVYLDHLATFGAQCGDGLGGHVLELDIVTIGTVVAAACASLRFAIELSASRSSWPNPDRPPSSKPDNT